RTRAWHDVVCRGGDPLIEEHGGQRLAIEAARSRGWITLDELLAVSSDSPIDPDRARELARDAGIQLIERETDPWEELHKLAVEGTSTLRPEVEEPTAQALE